MFLNGSYSYMLCYGVQVVSRSNPFPFREIIFVVFLLARQLKPREAAAAQVT